MVRFFLAVGLSCALALMAVSALPQKNQKDQKNQKEAPPTAGQVAAGSWAWGSDLSYVRNHFVRAAEEFPEDQYGYRPNEDVRTFGEIVLHVARVIHLDATDELGRPPDDVSEFAFHSKAQAVATLKKSFQELEEVAKQKPNSATVASSLVHASEHYGNLAVYYRLNGLVPPASR